MRCRTTGGALSIGKYLLGVMVGVALIECVHEYKLFQLSSLPDVKLHRNEYRPQIKSDLRPKYLIYLCDSRRRCGGWGDRQRGLVLAYFISRVLDREFGVVMKRPCDIQLYFQPSDIKWRIHKEKLINKTSVMLDRMSKKLIMDNFKGTEEKDVIYLKTNSGNFYEFALQFLKQMPMYIKKEDTLLRKGDVFREVWNRMMVPTQRLVQQIYNITNRRDTKQKLYNLVCAHVRIGQSVYLPNDHKELELSSIHKVWTFLEKFKTSNIFIATDHAQVRAEAKRKFGNRYVGSYAPFMNPDNMTKNVTKGCVAFETALIDQLVLVNCNILLYCNSGFSRHASFLKQSTNSTFYFDGSSIIPYGGIT